MIDLDKMTKVDNFAEWIIVHGTGGTQANPLADTSHHTFETVQNWHVNGLHWENIGYHFFIEKDGKLREGRPVNYHGAHCRGYNTKSIGICVAGNFDATLPTKEQEVTLINLLKRLSNEYNIPADKMVNHRKFNKYKTCPGNKLSDSWARDLYLENEIIEEHICKELKDYTNKDLLAEIGRRMK